jgi:hypothetical protein
MSGLTLLAIPETVVITLLLSFPTSRETRVAGFFLASAIYRVSVPTEEVAMRHPFRKFLLLCALCPVLPGAIIAQEVQLPVMVVPTGRYSSPPLGSTLFATGAQGELPANVVQFPSMVVPTTAAPMWPEANPHQKCGECQDEAQAMEVPCAEDSCGLACSPWWANVPHVDKFPRIGNAFIAPTGPGYYSLADVLFGEYREGPPKYAYPRFSIMQFSFFNADWRYLDKPDNQDHDFFDFLKRNHLGCNWLFTTGGEFRVRYNDENNSRLSGIDNNYYLTRTRVYGDLAFRDRVRVFAEFISANSFEQNLPPLLIDRNFGDILNLFGDLKLGEIKKHGVYVRGGRQELLFGSQRLLSPLDWANTRRTFQGGRLLWHGEKLDLDLFLVQPVIPNPPRLDSVDNDQVFSGFWGTYRPATGQNIDLYYLNLDQARAVAVGRDGVRGGFNVSTLGSRYTGLKDNWLWDLEGMLQFGGFSNQSLFAQAVTTGVGYHFKECPLSPVVWAYYDHASGDPEPGVGNTRRTFNQLFPFGHYYFGFVDVVGRQNIHDFNLHCSFFPTPWITTIVQGHVFRLDSTRDALYNAAGVAIRRDPTGQAGSDVGEEIDFLINFHLDKHQDILLSYSHLFAGSFLANTGNGSDADALYLQYSFRW